MAELDQAFQVSSKDTSMNTWNRVGVDECNIKNKEKNSTKPLKYIQNSMLVNGTDDSIYGKAMHHPSELMNRAELTNQRFIHQLQPDMLGLQAYEGSGAPMASINTNSNLRPEPARVHKSCNLPGVEIPRFDYIESEVQNPNHIVPSVDMWIHGGASSRNEFRNKCNGK